MPRALLRLALAVSAALPLVACGGGGPTPTPPVAAPPPATPTAFDVTPCLTQFVAPGQTVAILVIPDVLTIDVTRPASFPNGRTPADPVIDRTLALLFLDLTKEPIDRFHNIPVNPFGNDVPLPSAFPWLAPPFGGARVSQGGAVFNFRTDPESAFVRVDRMGMPAVATALIGSSAKNPYNDDSPAQDVTAAPAGGGFKWVPEIKAQLTALTNALGDDFRALGLNMCARGL